MCGDGAGPAMGWQIYGILERFIKIGPVGKLDGEGEFEHRHMTIKTIDINVETPPGVDTWAFGPPQSGFLRNGTATTVLDPLHLARFVATNMSGLVSGGNVEWFNYGKILFEHVNFIVFRLDGAEWSKIDVAERLRDVGGFEEKYLTEEKLKEYKVATWAKRKERGLKVLED